MNDVLSLLSTRRSVGPALLTGPGPSDAQIETLLTIAARVPDHGRLVPWRFVVIGPDAGRRVGEAIARAFQADNPDADAARIETERNRLTRAPLVVAVISRAAAHPKIPDWEQVLSAGAVCMTLSIAAKAMGFGCSWITEWYAFDRRVLEALGLAPTEKIAGFVHIGTPKEAPQERPRPKLADIVTRL
jgi:nitroreductase